MVWSNSQVNTVKHNNSLFSKSNCMWYDFKVHRNLLKTQNFKFVKIAKLKFRWNVFPEGGVRPQESNLHPFLVYYIPQTPKPQTPYQKRVQIWLLRVRPWQTFTSNYVSDLHLQCGTSINNAHKIFKKSHSWIKD